jgi:hypothetical protein
MDPWRPRSPSTGESCSPMRARSRNANFGTVAPFGQRPAGQLSTRSHRIHSGARRKLATMVGPLLGRFGPLCEIINGEHGCSIDEPLLAPPRPHHAPPPPPPGAGPKGEGGEADLDRIHCTYVPHPPSTALPCIPSRSWNPRFLFTSRASGDHLEFSPCLRPARPLDTPHIRSLQSRTTHWNQSRDIDHHTTKKHRIDTCTSLYHITIRHPTRAQAGTGIRSSMGL